jgi:effector-binding domain-containing protein
MQIKLSKNQWEFIGKKAGWTPSMTPSIRKKSSILKKIRKMSESGDDKTDIVRDIINLSSNTIATLSGKKDYQSIEDVQNKFVEFAQKMQPQRQWKNWVDAWQEFWQTELTGNVAI